MMDFFRPTTPMKTPISTMAGKREQKPKMIQREEQGRSSNTTRDRPTEAQAWATNERRQTEKYNRGFKINEIFKHKKGKIHRGQSIGSE